MSLSPLWPQPVDITDVRVVNLAVVLRHVRAAAPCSRADIAAATGLNKTTVSSLVAELIGRRMLRETGLTEHRLGRPATTLAIDGSRHVGLGIEVGVDHLTAVAVDLAGNRILTWRHSFPVPHKHFRRVVAEVAQLVRRAEARIHAGDASLVGLTLAVPGLVGPTGVVRSAPALGFEDVDLRASLEQALPTAVYPIAVAGDAMLGAVAEHRYGAYAGTADLLYLSGTPSLRAGVIVGGMPLHGANGYSGAIGHLPGDANGPACPHTALDPDVLIGRTGVVARDVEVEQLARRAETGDEAALRGLARLGRSLGYAVALLANLLDPAVVLLGGDYAPLTEWLRPTLEQEHRRFAVEPDARGLRLAASNLGYDAPALGGAGVALDTIDLLCPQWTK